MKLIDRLVIRELIAPWFFGVALFTALLLAGTYLNRIADYIVRGVPPMTVGELTVLLLPAFLAKTFGMAMLLASLLSFGRLSSDSEITALKASGASVMRIVAPVMGFSLLVAGVTFALGEWVVPPAATRAAELLVKLADEGNPQSGDPIVVKVDGGKALLAARSFNLAARTMSGVNVTTYDDSGRPKYVLLASEMEYRGEKEWHIRGATTLISLQTGWRLQTNEVWPDQVPQITDSPQDLLTINNGDNDIYSLEQIQGQIERGSREKNLSRERIANLWYGYWNKFSVPLASVIFGTLGAVLGIRGSRTSTAAGFALAVGIIFGYVTLANFMNVWALNGVLPAWVAAFLPLALGLAGSMYLMWRRNA